jgi:hypothetical protein
MTDSYTPHMDLFAQQVIELGLQRTGLHDELLMKIAVRQMLIYEGKRRFGPDLKEGIGIEADTRLGRILEPALVKQGEHTSLDWSKVDMQAVDLVFKPPV